MRPEAWASWKDYEMVKRRAGGRRRYNAQRRKRAEARQAAIDRWLCEHPAAGFFPRGLPAYLAPAFGVHPSTIWRDLQLILWRGSRTAYYCQGELLYTVRRAYPGGPVLSVTDPEGNEIRGEARRRILSSLPRYRTSRRRRR